MALRNWLDFFITLTVSSTVFVITFLPVVKNERNLNNRQVQLALFGPLLHCNATVLSGYGSRTFTLLQSEIFLSMLEHER